MCDIIERKKWVQAACRDKGLDFTIFRLSQFTSVKQTPANWSQAAENRDSPVPFSVE